MSNFTNIKNIEAPNLKSMSEEDLRRMGINKKDIDDLIPEDVLKDKLGEEPAKEEPQAKKEEVDLLPLQICSRCGWDKKSAFVSDITDEDKLQFVESLVTGDRFTKTYQRFGGVIEFCFRDITPDEHDEAAAKMNKKVTESYMEVFGTKSLEDLTDPQKIQLELLVRQRDSDNARLSADYLSAVSTHYVKIKGNVVYSASDKIEDPDVLHRKLFHDVIKSNHVRSAFRTCYASFTHLLQHMSVRAYDENFFPDYTKRG